MAFLQKILSSVLLLSVIGGGPVFAQETVEEIEESDGKKTEVVESDAEKSPRLFRDEEWTQLLPTAKRWTETAPDEWQAWFYLAAANEGLNDNDNALQHYLRAWKLSPQTDPHLRVKIGDAFGKQKKWAEAEKHYRLALQADGKKPYVWEKLTDVILASDQRDKTAAALAAMKKTMSFATFKYRYPLWARYAKMLDAANESEPARVAYRHLLSMRRQDVPSWERLFILADAAGDRKEVAEVADTILEFDSFNPLVHTYLGEKAYKARHKRAAKKYFEGVINHRRARVVDRATAMMRLGDLSAVNSHGQALAYYRRVIALQPHNLTAWERAVVTLKAMGQREKSQQYFLQMRRVEKLIAEGKPIILELSAI